LPGCVSPISDVLQKVTSARISEKPLQDLYQLLIKPIAAQLPTEPNQPVIFIPHGELFVVPFTALQDEQGKYLIEKHTILTAPSIQVLELTRQQKTARSKEKIGQPLVMGNPTMPTIPLTDPPQQLPSLPGAEAEAKAIAQELGTQPILGNPVLSSPSGQFPMHRQPN
jgi:CHAT domain-containing protein